MMERITLGSDDARAEPEARPLGPVINLRALLKGKFGTG
jgi:hypothetical protein